MFASEPEDERRAEDEREPTESAADAIIVDGRIVGPPTTDRDPEDEFADSPELDAEVQGDAAKEAR